MKTSAKWMLGSAVVMLAAIGLWSRHALSPRIVARAITPDGGEMCVLQRFNWGGEPFITGFVFRKPGEPWKWYYYDHQDWYWGNAHVTFDTNSKVAVVYRKGIPAITMDWDRELYTLHRFHQTRDNPAAMPLDWSPAREGYR